MAGERDLFLADFAPPHAPPPPLPFQNTMRHLYTPSLIGYASTHTHTYDPSLIITHGTKSLKGCIQKWPFSSNPLHALANAPIAHNYPARIMTGAASIASSNRSRWCTDHSPSERACRQWHVHARTRALQDILTLVS